MSPARFVFVDETSAATNMARRYGRSPAAERLVGPCRTAIGSSTPSSPASPARLHRPPDTVWRAMTGAAFIACVEQMLAPELGPGDIVVLDNLAAHKVDGVAKAIIDRRRRDPLPAALFT